MAPCIAGKRTVRIAMRILVRAGEPNLVNGGDYI